MRLGRRRPAVDDGTLALLQAARDGDAAALATLQAGPRAAAPSGIAGSVCRGAALVALGRTAPEREAADAHAAVCRPCREALGAAAPPVTT